MLSLLYGCYQVEIIRARAICPNEFKDADTDPSKACVFDLCVRHFLMSGMQAHQDVNCCMHVPHTRCTTLRSYPCCFNPHPCHKSF